MDEFGLEQLDLVSDQEIKISYPQYTQLLRFNQRIHCDEDGALRFVSNPLVRWLLSTSAVDLDDLEAAYRYGHFPRKSYLGFLLGVGYTLEEFLELDVVKESLSIGEVAAVRQIRERDFALPGTVYRNGRVA